MSKLNAQKEKSRSGFKHWFEEEIHSVPFDNARIVMNWLDDHLKRPPSNHRLLGYNKELFKKIWGRQTAVWTGSEFRFHVWVRKFEGETFIVLTNSTKGTCYEMVVNKNKQRYDLSDHMAAIAVRFWEDLLKEFGGTKKNCSEGTGERGQRNEAGQRPQRKGVKG